MNASHLVERPVVAFKRLHQDFYVKKILTWEEYQVRCKEAQERWDRAKSTLIQGLCKRCVR